MSVDWFKENSNQVQNQGNTEIETERPITFNTDSVQEARDAVEEARDCVRDCRTDAGCQGCAQDTQDAQTSLVQAMAALNLAQRCARYARAPGCQSSTPPPRGPR